MAKGILDSEGREFSHLPIDISAGQETSVFILQVKAEPGRTFKQTPAHAFFAFWARRHGTMDAFVDLSAGGIDLTAFPETWVEFDVKGVASAGLVDAEGFAVDLARVYSESAQWMGEDCFIIWGEDNEDVLMVSDEDFLILECYEVEEFLIMWGEDEEDCLMVTDDDYLIQ